MSPAFRVAFPSVFRPKEFNGKKKYQVCMLFDKGEDLSVLKKLVKSCAEEKWGKMPKPFHSPFRDGDEEKDLEKYPSFTNTIFVTASTNDSPDFPPPQVIDQKRQPIIDESEFYAGCYARTILSVFAWEFQGKKGVSFNLGNVQKVKDGKRLGGRVDASDEFEELPSDDDFDSNDEFGDDDI